MMFRVVFWVDNHFTRQYIPEDNSEHNTNTVQFLKTFKSQKLSFPFLSEPLRFIIYRHRNLISYGKAYKQKYATGFSYSGGRHAQSKLRCYHN
jgi:hypothetical protein